MKVLFLVKKRDACYFYRVLQPSSHLIVNGHMVQEELLELQEYCKNCRTGMHEFQFYRTDDQFACPNCQSVFDYDVRSWKKKVSDGIEWADLVVFQRTTDLDHLKLMQFVKSLGKPAVLEADDNYLDIDPTNTGYEYYSGRKAVIEEMLRVADCVTVTVPGLKTAYEKYNNDIVILPNCLDLEIIDVEPKISNPAIFNRRGIRITTEEFQGLRQGKTFIGWGGSPTHERDLELVVGAIKRLSKTENVIFGFVGYIHRAILEVLPEDRLVLFGLVPVNNYFSLYKTLSFDVGIAPVAEIEFNRGKSPLKVLEYHALGILPVASDFITYSPYIHEGILARGNNEYGWFSALRAAVNCEDRQARLQANRKYVEENFDIKKTVRLWESVYQRKIEEKA